MAVGLPNADLPQAGFDRLGGGRDAFDADDLVWSDFFSATSPPAGGTQLRYWTGSAWVTGTLRRWNGATWESATLRRWDGASWATV